MAKTRVQMINRRSGHNTYLIDLPSEIANVLQIQKGEMLELTVKDNANLLIHRLQVHADNELAENSEDVKKNWFSARDKKHFWLWTKK